MANDSIDVRQYLPDLASEVIFSCFGARKTFPVKDRQTGDLIGYSGTPAFEGTVLEGRPPLCVFIFCNGQGDSDSLSQTCDRAVDQLNAHRLAETCVILCARKPSKALRSLVEKTETGLPSSQILRVFHIDDLKEKRRELASFTEFVDEVFAVSE